VAEHDPQRVPAKAPVQRRAERALEVGVFDHQPSVGRASDVVRGRRLGDRRRAEVRHSGRRRSGSRPAGPPATAPDSST
jgi:hypothetical protein